ncbi:MAG: hypothetical protein LH615_11585 [Ferruginibacter sp.]|nr:hypothetical protein [Ferruginibacter sp.]
MLHLNDDNKIFVVSYLTLRIGLGFVGLLLPIVLTVGSLLFDNCGQVQPSISHYYYTVMGNYFVGSLCAVAMFLFFYKGPKKIDGIIANIAAVAALLVAFFPTDEDEMSVCKYFFTERLNTVNYIHFTAAALLFSCFAFFCLFLFTKRADNGLVTDKKKVRNSIYKTCGIIIVICIILIAVYNLVDNLVTTFAKYKPTLVLESIALFAFGASWITKGEMFLKDKRG